MRDADNERALQMRAVLLEPGHMECAPGSEYFPFTTSHGCRGELSCTRYALRFHCEGNSLSIEHRFRRRLASAQAIADAPIGARDAKGVVNDESIGKDR